MDKEQLEIERKVMEAYPITKREQEGCIVETIQNLNYRAILRKRLINELRAAKQKV